MGGGDGGEGVGGGGVVVGEEGGEETAGERIRIAGEEGVGGGEVVAVLVVEESADGIDGVGGVREDGET